MDFKVLCAATVVAAIGVASGSPIAQARSCSGGNLTERMICATPELSRMHSTMLTAYRRAWSDSPRKHAEINHEQRRWKGRRNSCGSDAACIRSRYNEQIGFLESFFKN